MRRVERRGFAAACSAGLGKLAFWLFVLAGPWQPTSPAVAQTTGAAAPSVPSGPDAWGVVGFDGFLTGLRPAPNGLSYDPLLSLHSDINFGLLPNKQLYLFLNNGFWVQRSSTRFSGVSQRELDVQYGVAWNYWDSLELRLFGYALNNLNRGTSLAAPQGYKDGWGVENRYYFHYPDIYDVSRLGYVSLGYYPSNALVGNNGQTFKPGLFARGHLTESLPTPFVSYLYGGLGITAENVVTPRLFGGDFGIAVRPIADRQNLEFRVGDAFNDDLKASEMRNYIYGAVSLGFETGPSSGRDAAPVSSLAFDWPEAWGDIGLLGYVASSHMAPNGVAFAPIFSIASDLNLGLLPNKQLYMFWDGDFWAEHSNDTTNSKRPTFAWSKREMDSNLGLAWNYYGSFELRGSVYALNNLNRGDSKAVPNGGNEGVILENRYDFASPDPYDVGRSSYVGFGYIPTETLVGGNGESFRPGPFAHAYLARDLPIPWFRSYLYADMRVTAEHTALPRLFDTDVGWAVRPIARWQSLEFRIGDDLTQDVVAAATRNLIYAAIRFNFGPGGFGRLSR